MRLHNWSAPGLSLRSRVVTEVFASTWRPAVTLLPVSDVGIGVGRLLIDVALRRVSPPVPGVVFAPIHESDATGDGVRGEWVRRQPASEEDAVVLYLHGSGYAICSPRTHRGLTSQLADRTGLSVFCLEYRLAPENSHPAALDDVRAAWDWLQEHGHPAERIVVAGDSAGAHLALLLALELARSGERLPAALVCLSPFIDMNLADATVRDRVERDPFSPPTVARRVLALYADATERSELNRRVCFDDVPDFPPTLVHNGSREMLAADCAELVRRMRAADLVVSHRAWPGQMHVFQALTAVLAESHTALGDIAEFIGRQLTARPADRPDHVPNEKEMTA